MCAVCYPARLKNKAPGLGCSTHLREAPQLLSCFAMAVMLGWALSQLATLQDSVEEQGERLEQCFEAVLPSGA